jgi:hypothetical protein
MAWWTHTVVVNSGSSSEEHIAQSSLEKANQTASELNSKGADAKVIVGQPNQKKNETH